MADMRRICPARFEENNLIKLSMKDEEWKVAFASILIVLKIGWMNIEWRLWVCEISYHKSAMQACRC